MNHIKENTARILKRKKLFLFDMDGTLYIGDELFDSSRELIELISKRGGRSIFLTNNSSKSVNDYVKKMNSLGFSCGRDDFFTSTEATARFLSNEKGIGKIYVFGTASLKSAFEEYGFDVTDELMDGIDTLVMGFDTELSFRKLEDACILLGKGVRYIATNPDYVCPTSYGYVPDCGSVADMLYNATGRRPRFIGKPETDMALLAIEKSGYSKEDTVLVGDRIYTDIACAVNAGITSLLVLSGETDSKALKNSDIKPDIVLPSVNELYEILK